MESVSVERFTTECRWRPLLFYAHWLITTNTLVVDVEIDDENDPKWKVDRLKYVTHE